jgi:hypothetical protein
MVGDNIIIAYCPICKNKITQAQETLGVAVIENGELVHASHLEKFKSLVSKEDVIECLMEVFENRFVGEEMIKELSSKCSLSIREFGFLIKVIGHTPKECL